MDQPGFRPRIGGGDGNLALEARATQNVEADTDEIAETEFIHDKRQVLAVAVGGPIVLLGPRRSGH